MEVTVRRINILDTPKEDRGIEIAAAFERDLAKVIFRDPTLGGGWYQLRLKVKKRVFDLTQCNTGKITVAAWVRTARRWIIVSASQHQKIYEA